MRCSGGADATTLNRRPVLAVLVLCAALSMGSGAVAVVDDARAAAQSSQTAPSARTVRIPASVDTWVMRGSSRYAGSQRRSNRLLVGTRNGRSVARSFLRFPTHQLIGVRVRSARLRLYNQRSLTCNGSAVRAAPIRTAWSAKSLTWNNQPSVVGRRSDASSAARGVAGACAAGYVTYDVTAAVQAWADGARNRGLRLAADNESSRRGWRRFRSREHVAGHRPSEPRLVVTYEPAPTVTHFQTDTGHSGVQPGANVGPPLALRWKRHNTLQPQAGSSWPQTPLIVDGVVYSLEGQYQASVLSARRLDDGAPLWERVFPLQGYGRGSISFDAGRLFVVHSDRVTAVNPRTGRDVWAKPGPGDWGLAAVGDGVLAVSNRLLDATTGDRRRAVTPGGDAWVQRAMGGTVVNDAWYVVTTDHLSRYSLSTGAEQWTKPAAGFGAGGNPVIANSDYVVESEFSNGINTLYVSSASDGKAIRTLPGTLPPVLDGSTVVVANDRSVSAVDLATGATSWTTPPLDEPVAMPPAVAGGHVYVATTASTSGPSHLYVLDRATGVVRWSTNGIEKCGYRYYFGYGSFWPSIAVAQGRVAVPTDCGVAVYGPA